LTSSLEFRHLISGSLVLVSLKLTCHGLSLTLTTLALNQRSLRWFGAYSCKSAPGGLPLSLVQLRTLSL